ncbi:hypothetical protein ACTHO0_25835 [Cytobacillus praedii]|uniref:hypothetical protein n=1 Tax=Cytobacillus praedii TaxID=1742358 RepID=UPI003F7FC3EB
MSNPTDNNKKQQNKSLNNNQESGSDYHRKHAGHVEGYGEIYPNAKNMSDTTEQ